MIPSGVRGDEDDSWKVHKNARQARSATQAPGRGGLCGPSPQAAAGQAYIYRPLRRRWPLKEPLEFDDLSMFDWVVIGAQTETRQPSGVVPAFAPPFEWVARIVLQAREAGCKIHLKPNLLTGPGMQLPNEYPN